MITYSYFITINLYYINKKVKELTKKEHIIV